MTREKLARSGSNNTYDKKCLSLTDEEVARRTKAGEKSIIRINDGNLPKRSTPTDIVFGHLSDSHASLPTDPILLKSDLFPTYHLASIVDDHEMGITHVLRGEEWLPSLPLHLDLYASLSLKPPQYAHLPILLNLDGTKMSKRNGDVQVIDFIRTGWESEAVLNWLALAGWGVNHSTPPQSPNASSSSQAPDSTTVMTMEEIAAQFDPSSLTHHRNIMDPSKLQYLNKHHLRRLWSTKEGLDGLARRVHNLVKEAFPTSPFTTLEYLKKVILTLESRLVNIYDIPRVAPYLFQDPDLSSDEAKSLKKSIPEDIYKQVIEAAHPRLSQLFESTWDSNEIGKVLSEVHDMLGIKQKTYMTVLRHALSGMKTGPSVPSIMHALGKERTLDRLKFESTS